GFGVTLMPANPVSPISEVKVERYAPGGGSNLVGDVVDDIVEEHAPTISVQTMKGAVNRIEPSHGTGVAHTGLFVIDWPLSLEARNRRQNINRRKRACSEGLPQQTKAIVPSDLHCSR